METLLEEGLLSGIISEVNKGLRESDGELVRMHASETSPQRDNSKTVEEPARLPRKRKKNNELQERRKQVLEEMSVNAYGGVNIFEDVTPIPEKPKSQEGKFGSLRDQDPHDPGIDLSQFGF